MFDVSKSYGEMLKKIAVFTLGTLIFDWFLILLSFPDLKEYINYIVYCILKADKPIKIFNIELPLS